MNLRQLYSLHPLGCDHFGAQWLELWLALGRLLRMPARVEYHQGGAWRSWPGMDRVHGPSVGGFLLFDFGAHYRGIEIRVVLLTGTVIREWMPT